MKLSLTLLFCSLYGITVAQTDSSWIDLGRIKLKKDFTQTVTVKGKDLEQMPFSTLDEALTVWLSGFLTTKTALVYVVDGSILADVHAYSIQDIEEITLVQNAAAHLNGARQNQLVLISTKKNRTATSGVTVAGAAYAVKNSVFNGTQVFDAETNLYHRYDITAWKHSEKIQYGVSVGYFHDVMPLQKDYLDVKDPYQLNRFRFHGYLDAAVDARNRFWLRAGYVPGVVKVDIMNTATAPNMFEMKNREKLFTIQGGWNTAITHRLTNEFSVGYAPATRKGTSSYNNITPITTPVSFPDRSAETKNNFNNLLLNDELSYHMQAGDLQIDPAVDLSFRKLSSKIINKNRANTGGLPSGSFSESRFNTDLDVFLVTPSLNLSFKNIFNIQGGFVYNPSDKDFGAETKKFLPFVTTGVDVIQIFRPATSTASWKLFGSYAAAGRFADHYYQLSDVTNTSRNIHVSPYAWPIEQTFFANYGGDNGAYDWQLGSVISVLNKRLELSYNYERNKYNVLIYSPTPGGVNTYIDAKVKNSTHRAGITAKVLQGERTNWLAGLNASSSWLEAVIPGMTTGGIVKARRMWTGGLVNRFQCGRFMAGADLLYVFNYRLPTIFTLEYEDGVSLNNLYLGYQLKLKAKPFDVFVETRNPSQKDDSKLPERRQFYGAGFKATI